LNCQRCLCGSNVVRLTGVQPNSSRITNENSILDGFSRTFPLKHNLYFDFRYTRQRTPTSWKVCLEVGSHPIFADHRAPAEPYHMEPFAEWYWRKFCVPPLWPPNRTTKRHRLCPMTYMVLNNQRTFCLGQVTPRVGTERIGGANLIHSCRVPGKLAPDNAVAEYTCACLVITVRSRGGSITNGAPLMK